MCERLFDSPPQTSSPKPTQLYALGNGAPVSFCPPFNTSTNTAPQHLVGPWHIWNKRVTRSIISQTFSYITLCLWFSHSLKYTYCWIFSRYHTVQHFSFECFTKACSFCWFKWVEFLRTEPLPYLFCITSLPLALLSKHMPTHRNLCLMVPGTGQGRVSTCLGIVLGGSE